MDHRHLTQLGVWITAVAALAAEQDAIGILAGVGAIAHIFSERVMANSLRAKEDIAAELAERSAESRAILAEVRKVATTASLASTATLEIKRNEMAMFDSQPPNAWSGPFRPQS